MNNGDRWWVMTFDEYRKGIDGQSWEDNKREREQTEYRQEFEEEQRNSQREEQKNGSKKESKWVQNYKAVISASII